MTQDGVSPAQGHEPIARAGVTAAPVHSLHSSIPILTSQFRGPFVYNETEEERKKREEEEQKKKDDEEKKSNFKKVQEKAEAEKKRADEAERKLKEREEADRKAAEAKLAEDGKLKELADAKAKEAADKAAEAAREKARADEAEKRLKEIDDQQEAELAELLKTIPKEKQPPLDPKDPVSKRLAQAKYAASLLAGPKPPIGGGARNGGSNPDRVDELKAASKKRRLTEQENMELMELTDDSK